MAVIVICGLTATKTMEETVRIQQFVKKEKRRFLPLRCSDNSLKEYCCESDNL